MNSETFRNAEHVDDVGITGGSLVALGETVAQNGQELLAEFVQYGHQKPFEEIVRRYAGMVFNVCFRITKDKHEAEDATQAVFLTLALQAKRGTDIKALGPWLQQVAKRLALDNRRSKKRRQNREERHQQETTFRRECIDDLALPSADLDELKTILHEELQKMPTKYRLPLILHYFGGLSREEMAAELNCKPSTLGVRIFRGREMLAGRLSGRGINISAAMLATLMGYAVKRAVSETLIASTSHAATAMAMGHSGAGMASAHVIGLTRKATGALVIGKVRVAAFTMLLAGTSLGAGAKALGILPKIDVQRIISNQILRLMRPIGQPFTSPLRVDAHPASHSSVATPQTLAATTDILASLPQSIPTPIPHYPINRSVSTGSTSDQTIVASTINSPSTWTGPVSTSGWNPHANPSATVAGSDSSSVNLSALHADVSESGSSGAGGGGGSSGFDAAAIERLINAAPTFTKSTGVSSDSMGDVAISMNDLIIGSSSSANRSLKNAPAIASSATSAAPIQMVQLSTIGGSVMQSSAGVIRGWGKIDRTGTLDVNGQVIADGQGIDRTLNLTSFTAVQTQTPSPSASTTASAASSSTAAPVPAANSAAAVATVTPEGNGYFAVNHGRLELPLEASNSSSSTLTWGDSPDSSHLSLVNSVRLKMASSTASSDGGTDSQPAELALLSPDRDDAPCLSAIDGVAIGLWELDPGTSDTASADLSICYDSALLNELGASASSLELWTSSGAAGNWQTVSLNSLEVDTNNHVVSGYAQDFSYFAVSVIPAAGENASHIVAHHLAQTSPGTGSPSVNIVPEPVTLPLLAAGMLGLLGRRRKNILH